MSYEPQLTQCTATTSTRLVTSPAGLGCFGWWAAATTPAAGAPARLLSSSRVCTPLADPHARPRKPRGARRCRQEVFDAGHLRGRVRPIRLAALAAPTVPSAGGTDHGRRARRSWRRAVPPA